MHGINRKIHGYTKSDGDDYLTGRDLHAKRELFEAELSRRAYPLVRGVPCAVYLDGVHLGDDLVETDEEALYGLGCAGRSAAEDAARVVFAREGLRIEDVQRGQKLEVRYGTGGVALIPDVINTGMFEERSLRPLDLAAQKKQRQDVDDALRDMREAARERQAGRD